MMEDITLLTQVPSGASIYHGIHRFLDFLMGGLAGVGAGFFTNPLEVVKIRMQLQGELQARGHHEVYYKNFFNAFYVIAKHDGVSALQAGLVPAQWFQLIFNGVRLGTYQVVSNKGYVTDNNGNIVFPKIVLASGLAGVIGTIVASPFFLVKIHLQAQAAKEIAFGHQHNHEGTWSALKKIYRETGIKGLFRGYSAAIPRVFFGSMSQLTAFDYSKEWLQVHSLFPSSPLTRTSVASFLAGFAVSVVSTPFDLIATRLYNQGVDANGKGLIYNSYFDCVAKIWRKEGIIGFYKGIGANAIRVGPHTILTFLMWDQLKAFQNKIRYM